MIVYLYKLGVPTSTYTTLTAAQAMESGKETDLMNFN